MTWFLGTNAIWSANFRKFYCSDTDALFKFSSGIQTGFFLKYLFSFSASRYTRDLDSFRQIRPGYGKTKRRGSGEKVWFRRWLLFGKSVMVAKNQAENLVHVWWTLLFISCQGRIIPFFLNQYNWQDPNMNFNKISQFFL